MAYIFWKGIRSSFKFQLVVDLIFFFIFVKLLLYYLMPTVLRIISDYQFLKIDRVDPIELVYVYGIEFISWMFWLLTLYLIFKLIGRDRQNSMKISNYMNHNRRMSITLLYIITFGFIAINISRMFNYSSFYLDIFQTLFYSAGLASGPFLLVTALKFYNKKLFFLGVVSTIFSIAYIGTRGALVYALIFICYLVFFVVKSNRQKILAITFIAMFSGFYFIFSGLPNPTLSLDENGEVSIESTISTKKLSGRSPYEEIEWRFGAQTRLGVSFIRLYNRGEGAGINPIKHSFLGFLPRSINPDKPIPSTLIADDIYSQGMYMAYRDIHGYDTFSMVEFPTGGHFYWEFGLFGVIFLSVISAVYIGVTSPLLSRLGPVSIPLVVAIFKPWGFMDPKIWISEAILQIYQIILPLLLLILILKLIFFLKVVAWNFLLVSSKGRVNYKKRGLE
jgi:hypothetical protein